MSADSEKPNIIGVIGRNIALWQNLWVGVGRFERRSSSARASLALALRGRSPYSWITIRRALRKRRVFDFVPQDPLEAILVIFGRGALIFFCLKALGKIWKCHHFCAHAQCRSPWRRKNVGKGHIAPSNLTFLLIAIDRNGFRRMKEEGQINKTLPQFFFYFCLGT